MAKRISHKNVGEVFTLQFADGKKAKYQLMKFMGFTNVPAGWVAHFTPQSMTPGVYGTTLTLTRHNNRWVYGTKDNIVRSVDY